MIPYMLAGYVLAGGASRRMGRDKALLPFEGSTLLEFVAHQVQDAAGSVTIIGPPDRYQCLGFRVIPDRRPDCGPLAGIEAALLDTSADWNLIVACDMPGLNAGLLRRLFDEVEDEFSGIITETPDGRAHPLCAVYHCRAASAVTSALDHGVRKVLDGLKSLRIKKLSTPSVQNVNTPHEWAELAD